MSRVSAIDIPEYVEQFCRRYGPGRTRIVAMTYQFDPEVFELRFERVFRRPGVRFDVVTGEPPDRARRDSYHVWRANWAGTFHPKLLILLVNHRIAVGLGSANLRSGGLGGNLECWHFVEEAGDGRRVLADIRQLLCVMEKKRILSRHLEIDEMCSALPTEQGETILSTLYARLVDQVAEKVQGPVRRLDILSPLNCDPGKPLKEIQTLIGAREVHLFTNMKTIPVIGECHGYWTLKPPECTDEDEKVSIFSNMHAKMYAFWNSGRVDLFWGSANLSHSAWLRTGPTANVEVMVHSRISERQWLQLRDHLPAGHFWGEIEPDKTALFSMEATPKTDEWRLLHAVWTGRVLLLEASRSGRLTFSLRRVGGRAVRMTLVFDNMQTTIPSSCARRLGFGVGSAPESLEVALRPKGVWHALPVNTSGAATTGLGAADVLAQLFWQYTGRPLPGFESEMPRRPVSATRTDPLNVDSEEEELTRTFHQGKLDRFVLQWRLTARRIAACSRGTPALMQYRFREALRMIRTEAQEHPEAWPATRYAFVEKVFEDALAGRV